VIPAQTSRNRESVLRLLELSDCPYRAIGKQTQYCGAQDTTIFADDFEADRGWTPGPNTASGGRFERGNPAQTGLLGAKQLGTTVSGQNDLVTGRLAGLLPGSHDVDGGLTKIVSPPIALTGGSSYKLSFKYYMAHDATSSSVDNLRVRVANETVLLEQGAANNDNAAWATANVDISPFAGSVVRITVEAADQAGASLVEAAVDDVKVTRG